MLRDRQGKHLVFNCMQQRGITGIFQNTQYLDGMKWGGEVNEGGVGLLTCQGDKI